MIFPPVFVLAEFFAGFSRPERILFLINIYISSKIMGVDFHTFASTKTWLIVNFRSLSYNYFCWFLHTWTLRPWHKQPFQFNINKLCVWLLGCFCNFQLWTMNNKVATTCVRCCSYQQFNTHETYSLPCNGWAVDLWHYLTVLLNFPILHLMSK